MNEKQWQLFQQFMEDVILVLDEIAKNTRPEDVTETKSSVKGFRVGGTD